jgi:hypothetical protein
MSLRQRPASIRPDSVCSLDDSLLFMHMRLPWGGPSKHLKERIISVLLPIRALVPPPGGLAMSLQWEFGEPMRSVAARLAVVGRN